MVIFSIQSCNEPNPDDIIYVKADEYNCNPRNIPINFADYPILSKFNVKTIISSESEYAAFFNTNKKSNIDFSLYSLLYFFGEVVSETVTNKVVFINHDEKKIKIFFEGYYHYSNKIYMHGKNVRCICLIPNTPNIYKIEIGQW